MITIITIFVAIILTIVIAMSIIIIIARIIARIAAIITMLVQEPGHACHLYNILYYSRLLLYYTNTRLYYTMNVIYIYILAWPRCINASGWWFRVLRFRV